MTICECGHDEAQHGDRYLHGTLVYIFAGCWHLDCRNGCKRFTPRVSSLSDERASESEAA